jgi:cobaltochelatase CobT subunit
MGGLLQSVGDWWRIYRARDDRRPMLDPPKPLPYRPYTTSFDREVRIEDISEVATPDPRMEAHLHRSALAAYATGRQTLATAKSAWTDAFSEAQKLISKDRDRVVVSILVDQSGSLKTEGKSVLTALSADWAAKFFLDLGCAVEVLCFTTRSWRGGRSRDEWIRAGRPRYPGRLCDLLHIIYRAADDPSVSPPDTIAEILRPEWLKENVDGEALLWAAGRLRRLPQNVKLLLVISDGAPVDDSTLIQNGPGCLYAHLRETIQSFGSHRDIALGAVGIHYEIAADLYPDWVQLASVEDIGVKLPDFMKSLIERGLSGARSVL